MGDRWFTTSGETGTISIAEKGDGWFVEDPEAEGEIKCILQGEFELSDEGPVQDLEIRVSKYMRAADQGPDFLFASPPDSSREQSEETTESGGTKSSSTSNKSLTPGSDATKCSLSELSGSGDYVTVEGVVDSVFWVKKDVPNVPDIMGSLVDDETGETRMFIVNEGVKHPYLEEGRKFVFSGARDHYYEKQDKVQLMITRYTDFTDKGLTETTSAKKSASSQKDSSGKSLRQIANEMIGGKEFDMNQQDRDSVVGKAKKQAKRQQRDPAIDPKLNQDR